MEIFHVFRIKFLPHPFQKDLFESGALKESPYATPEDLLSSFLTKRFDLPATKNNGTTEIYRAEVWGKQEGIVYTVVANNKIKNTTDENHEKVANPDHPYSDVIFDLRPERGYLFVQRNSAFSSRPDSVVKIIRDALNDKLRDYGLKLEVTGFNSEANDFWTIVNNIRTNFHDTVRNASIDFPTDPSVSRAISQDAMLNSVMQMALKSNSDEALISVTSYSEEGIDLQQCHDDITQILNICLTQGAPIGLRLNFKEFGIFRFGNDLDAQFGIDREQLEEFRLISSEAPAGRSKEIDDFALTQWIGRCTDTLENYAEKPLTFKRRKRSR